MIPFSRRNSSKDFSECLVFYEHDVNFAEVIRNPAEFKEDILRFKFMNTPDNSLYRDAPLTAQIANVYRNRAIGHFFQELGAYVITNVRWGDERSYTTEILPEKFAFLGAPKNSIVSIDTYGCIQEKENKYYFRAGLEAMLDELTPQVVLVYGSMPKKIFDGVNHKTEFVNYPDHKDGKKNHGIGQSWFPANWTPNDIRHAGEHVAGLRKNRHVPDGKISYGMYKGVRVCVIRTHGKIATIFPNSNQPTKK